MQSNIFAQWRAQARAALADLRAMLSGPTISPNRRARLQAANAEARRRTMTEPGRTPPATDRHGHPSPATDSRKRHGTTYKPDGSIRRLGYYVLLAARGRNRHERRRRAALTRQAA